mmetsp:Transcript_3192/g.8837  ORF Transcript_3192/g.8837 Transcript_3192/m.8837 type:complete len:224 (+) Transcript_3192:6926-7597(+)
MHWKTMECCDGSKPFSLSLSLRELMFERKIRWSAVRFFVRSLLPNRTVALPFHGSFINHFIRQIPSSISASINPSSQEFQSLVLRLQLPFLGSECHAQRVEKGVPGRALVVLVIAVLFRRHQVFVQLGQALPKFLEPAVHQGRKHRGAEFLGVWFGLAQLRRQAVEHHQAIRQGFPRRSGGRVVRKGGAVFGLYGVRCELRVAEELLADRLRKGARPRGVGGV